MKIRLRKKLISTLIIEGALLCASLFAISPAGTIVDIEQNDEVGSNIFPVGAYLNYGVYDFPTLPEGPLRFSVALSGGYTTNSISQNPSTGLANWDGWKYKDDMTTNEYGVIFSSYDFKLAQKIPVPFDLPGSLDTWTSFFARYERPVTKASDIGNLAAGGSLNSPFINSDGSLNDTFSTGDYVGTPDLNGNMYLRSFALKLGTRYSHKLFDLPYSWSQSITFAPEYLLTNSGTDKFGGATDYIKLYESFYISKNLKSDRYKGPITDHDFRLYSIVASNSLSYRYLKGDGVPIFIQDYNNLRNAISNTLRITFNGPQMITPDTYPYIYLEYVDEYRWGKLNNTSSENIYPTEDSFSHHYKIYGDMRIIGIIHLYAQYTWYLKKNSLISGSGKSEYGFYVSI
ncbi:MAG: hypothetical protein ACRQFF_05430 [Sphaerochaeta sp.]